MKDLHLGFDSGYITNIQKNMIFHNCNTNPRCSGGDIIEKINNSIIGINKGSFKNSINIGIFIKCIINDIKNNNYFKIIENNKVENINLINKKDLNSNKTSHGPWEMSCENSESVESRYPCPYYDNCSIHSNNEPMKWSHSNCGSYLRLYENGK